MNKKVVCFGEVLWDCFRDGKKPGGAPMNVALHLRKQGLDSVLISAVGQDEDGKRMRAFLATKGLGLSCIQTNTAFATGLVEVSLGEKGQATYAIVEPVAWDAIAYKPEYAELVRGTDAFVYGSLAAREAGSRSALFKLLEDASLKVFDMNLRPPHFSKEIIETLLYRADILKINEDELRYLEAEYQLNSLDDADKLDWLSKAFAVHTICVTLGDKGAMAWYRGELFSHPGFKVEVVDTIGAGDAFLAAFIAGILEERSLPTILESACRAGAEVASKSGANPD